MEEFLGKEFDAENNIHFIGDSNLQIILTKNDNIIVNKKYIVNSSSYHLEETIYKNVNSLLFYGNVNNDMEKKVFDINLVRLKNKNDTFEYIGLKKGNQVMKIIPFLYKNFFIRNDCILAFHENLLLINPPKEIMNIMSYEKLIFMLRKITFQSYQKGNVYAESKDFYYCKKKENKDLNLNINNTNNLISDLSLMKEFIYFSSSSNNMLMEKRLGNNEHIIICSSCLLLFEDSVRFNFIENKKYISSEFFIEITGPGLIVYELFNESKILTEGHSQNINTLQKLRLLSLILSISIVLIHVLFFFQKVPKELYK